MELKKFLTKQIILILISALAIGIYAMVAIDNDIITLVKVGGATLLVLGGTLAVTTKDLVNGPYTQRGDEEYMSTTYNVQEPYFTPVNDRVKKHKRHKGPQTAETTEDYYHYPYMNGYCVVARLITGEDGSVVKQYSFKDKEGKYITEKWFDDVIDFNEFGCAIICQGEMYNIINTKGEILSIQWFYSIMPFNDGVAKVRWKDDSVNYVDASGKLLWKDWVVDNPAILEQDLNEDQLQQIKSVIG